MNNPVGGDDRTPDKPIPAGEYMLALVWFKRRTSARGNPYLRCRFVVCGGPKKGEGFFCPWSLDTSKPGCRKRWELWMEGVGCSEQIDLDDDGVIARVFRGKPFKAEVKREQRGEYESNDIDRLIYTRHYTARDQREMAEWTAEWNQQRDGSAWKSQDPGADPQTGQEQAPAGSEPQWSDDRFDPDADVDGDDIPF